MWVTLHLNLKKLSSIMKRSKIVHINQVFGIAVSFQPDMELYGWMNITKAWRAERAQDDVLFTCRFVAHP